MGAISSACHYGALRRTSGSPEDEQDAVCYHSTPHEIHTELPVSDYAASKAFFLKALEPLGVAVVSEGPPTYGVELRNRVKIKYPIFVGCVMNEECRMKAVCD
jgi:hypothetical protein